MTRPRREPAAVIPVRAAELVSSVRLGDEIVALGTLPAPERVA